MERDLRQEKLVESQASHQSRLPQGCARHRGVFQLPVQYISTGQANRVVLLPVDIRLRSSEVRRIELARRGWLDAQYSGRERYRRIKLSLELSEC